MNLSLGENVVFQKAIESQGVAVGSSGVIVSPHGMHLIVPHEFVADDSGDGVGLVDADYVHVLVFGKVLVVPVSVFDEPVVVEVINESESIGSVGEGEGDREANESFDVSGSSNDSNDGTSAVDSGAVVAVANSETVAAPCYTIKSAIAELRSDADIAALSGSSDFADTMRSVADKLETIAG